MRFAQDPAWKHRLDGAVEIPGVEKLDDSGVTIRSLIRTIPASQWEAAREFRRRIKNRLDAEGIEIPLPQRIMHVRMDDEQADQFLTGKAADRPPAGSTS
jgi:small-conductance mechanosensitive channel